MGNTELLPILKKLYPWGYTEAVSMCRARMDAQIKTAVFTPNSEMLLNAIRSDRGRKLLLSADMLFPDGIGAHISMKALGIPHQKRTTGIDLADKLIREISKRGDKVFLLGAKKGIAETAAKMLCSKYPGLNICGCHHGYFDKSGKENSDVIKKINRSGADILFVCFGFPAQEAWILKNLPRLKSVKLAIGLGGSLDVWSGKVSRAPTILSYIGLEWLWRTAIDPKRLPRTLKLVIFSFFAIKEVLFNRQKQYKCYEIDNFSK